MSEKEIIGNNLRKFFEEGGNKKVVILPLRNLSGMVKDILKDEYNLQEQFLIDNYAYDMEHIYPIDRMPEGYQDCCFLLAAFGSTKRALKDQLLKYVPENQIVDLLFDEEREQIFESDSKVHLDFLCAGFEKCGTTSLHYALAQNPRIFLPKVKETYFLRRSINKTTHEAFKGHYRAEETAGKLVGDIEPDYRTSAEDVYRYFGSDLKIIFCVRNPVEAIYSHFKMAMRGQLVMIGSDSLKPELMEGFGHVCPELFDHWTVKYRFRERYADYIKAFLKYYPIEQIKIIVSEELFVDISGYMDDLQDFLGLSREAKQHYSEFPRENVGTKVSRDPQGLKINMSMVELQRNLVRNSDFQSLDLLKEVRKQVEEITLVDYNEPMLESTRRNLLDYYMDSIHDLEGMLGRSLQGVWYE